MAPDTAGAYGPQSDLVDYIFGITYEIWQDRRIDLIRRYYGPETPVYALDNVVTGAAAVIDCTRAMLAAFPDRRLFPDEVIWSGSRDAGYYSSHRITSPMTNEGRSSFGPATGRTAVALTIADCVVENGVITREWLLRDNHALVTQLGLDVHDTARQRSAARTDDTRAWMESELRRIGGRGMTAAPAELPPANDARAFAECALANLWRNDGRESRQAIYAPYAVLHRSPVACFFGRDEVLGHYDALRRSFELTGLSVDHVAAQPCGETGRQLAVRWTISATHRGDYLGIRATDRPLFILGATHWRLVAGRVASEWTVFDGLGVASQLV